MDRRISKREQQESVSFNESINGATKETNPAFPVKLQPHARSDNNEIQTHDVYVEQVCVIGSIRDGKNYALAVSIDIWATADSRCADWLLGDIGGVEPL